MAALGLSPEKTPSALFIALWKEAEVWTGPQRTSARTPAKLFCNKVRKILHITQDAEAATDAIRDLLMGNTARLPPVYRGEVLEVMRAIDELFYLIHPRAVLAAPATGVRAPLPRWLKEARDRRWLEGNFHSDDDHLLIPRGPLLRGARHAFASSADNLADRYAALTVTARRLNQDGRPITVDLKRIPSSVSRGAPPGLTTGAEKIAFIPIAEAAEDVTPETRNTPGQMFVGFKPRDDLDPCAKILNALAEAGNMDLAIAPEFMVRVEDAEALAKALSLQPAAPRLIVAGTGSTGEAEDDQAWNEARMLNGAGAEVWRQRKLWPAGIDLKRARRFGIACKGDGVTLFEDNAAGEILTIADVDGLGRCAILICQDLKAELLAEQLVIHFQPDWIFVPLPDSGVGENRWMHAQAFGLSARAPTRFVMVSSTSLAERAGYKGSACAMAVGPEAPDTTMPDKDLSEVPRAFQIAHAETHGEARFAVIQWRQGRWMSSVLAARPSR